MDQVILTLEMLKQMIHDVHIAGDTEGAPCDKGWAALDAEDTAGYTT